MTGQHVRSSTDLLGQCSILTGHCPLTGRYFKPCPFTKSPSYLKERKLGWNLREETASEFRQSVKFIALPFPLSSQLKIWSVHVAVVQGRLRNVQKSVMHVQSCCFAQINLLSFERSRCCCCCRHSFERSLIWST